LYSPITVDVNNLLKVTTQQRPVVSRTRDHSIANPTLCR